MATVNLCAVLGGNGVGETPCAVKMGRIKYLLFTQGKVFSAADILTSASFRAALRTSMLLERGNSNKVYAFPLVNEGDDNTEDVEKASLADGYTEVLSEKAPAYTLRSVTNFCQSQAMTSFNGWKDKVFVIDHNNILWYVQTDTGGAQGFSVGDLYTTPQRWGVSGAIITSSISITFGSIDEFKGEVGAIKITFDPTKVINTNDVKLKEVDTAVGYVFTIGGNIKCAGTDIYSAYSTLLAVVGAWTAKLSATGAAVTISSVTADATNKGWDITLASSPTITTGAKIILNLASPTALAALGSPVLGLEGLEIEVTKAA